MTEIIQNLDGDLLISIQQAVIRESVTPAVRFITSLGNGGMIWIAFIILMLIFRKTRKDGIWTGCALAVSFVINNLILKNVIARVRPYEAFSAV